MNSNSGSTVRSYALNRLVNDMINAAVAAGKQAAPTCENYLLILDTYTSQIINSIAQPKDIFDTIIGLESIEKKRKAYPKFQAIYYLEPTAANLELVRQDIVGKLYGPVHLFFSRYIPDSVMEELRRMPEVIARIATLKELNLDFIVVDDCQFTLDIKEGLISKLYSNTPDYSTLSTVAEKLFTMISVFLPTSDLEVYTPRKSVAEPVAHQVMNKFKALASKNSNLVDQKAKKIKLVVLDRAFDPRTPAMHDLSYQPLVYDLCNLENNAAKILKENPRQGTKEVEVMKLDEKDAIWTDFRFKHIAQVSKEHPDKINEFTKNNSAAKFSKGEAGKDPGRNLEAMIRDYPQFVEVTSRLRLHQQLIEEATGKVELRGYRESAEAEVTVATGVNSNNEALSNSDIITIIQKEMRNPKFKDEDRARLAISVLCSMNLTQEQQNMVMNSCQDPKMHRSIQNMAYLGVRNEVSSAAKLKVSDEEKKFFKDYAKTVKYLSGHYLPKLYFLLKNIEDGKVSETHYSVQRYPGTAPQKRLISMDLAANKTFNIGKEKIDNKDKLIVFFVGGASYSEIRTVRDTSSFGRYLLEMITGRDDLFGIIGGTSILSPAAYLAELALIS